MKKLLAFALLCTVASPALSQTAVTLTTPGSEYGGGQYTLGFEFSLGNNSVIDSLGVYDNLGDGLTAPASIGIWDLAGNLLTSTTISAGSGTLDGLFRFQSISPFAVTANTHYIVGAYTTDLATSLNTGQGGTGSIDPNVTIYRDRYSNFNGTFSFPTQTDNNVGAWLGGNFQFNSAVPEPSTWAMMLFGFGAVGFAVRRRRDSGHAQLV